MRFLISETPHLAMLAIKVIISFLSVHFFHINQIRNGWSNPTISLKNKNVNHVIEIFINKQTKENQFMIKLNLKKHGNSPKKLNSIMKNLYNYILKTI